MVKLPKRALPSVGVCRGQNGLGWRMPQPRHYIPSGSLSGWWTGQQQHAPPARIKAAGSSFGRSETSKIPRSTKRNIEILENMEAARLKPVFSQGSINVNTLDPQLQPMTDTLSAAFRISTANIFFGRQLIHKSLPAMILDA